MAIFLGMIIILFHAITGIPKNNFDPLVGDTFKPLYYSFVFMLSFAFLSVSLFESKKIKITSLFLYIFLIVFLLGFPKQKDYDLQIGLVNKIEDSIYCEVEKSMYLKGSDFENIDCRKTQEKIPNPDDPNRELFENTLNHKPLNLLLIFTNVLLAFYSILNKKLVKFPWPKFII